MSRSSICLAVSLLALATTANAATLVFGGDPFAGTTALTTPGRQIVGGPGTPFNFDIASDTLAFDIGSFGINPIVFANALSTNLPTTGVNFIVLQDGAPLAAGTAANAIAAQVTSPGAGFFIYFNTGLDLPRLVYSTDLNDSTADLAILARLTNLNGQAGFDALQTISAANVSAVPEPSSILLTSGGVLLACVAAWRRRRSQA